MSQSQPLRIENPEFGSFGTCRTINSQFLFANNKRLEESLLANLAKLTERHEVELYAYAIQSTHYHPLAKFPKANRASFYRDLNARAAENVRRFVPEFKGGPVFERRYSEQVIPLDSDIEDRFFYCALQAVEAGLCERISEYPGYNSFSDAISGIKRKFKLVNWTAFNKARKKDPKVPIKHFIEIYTLSYKRLPGYEKLSQAEYKKLMLEKLEERRLKIVARYKKDGHVFMTKGQLKKVKPSSYAKNPKKSKRFSKRPLVLTSCAEARRQFLEWYFSIYDWYKKACKKYLSGKVDVEFPPGTYRPPGLCNTC